MSSEKKVENQSVIDSESEKKKEIERTEKKEKKSPSKKRKNPFVRFILAVLKIFLVLLIILFLWFVFSAFHRKSSLKTLPANYSFCFHTDSVYKAVNPIIDMEAVDKILSTNENTVSFLPVLMQIRKSPWRKNPLTAFVLSRKLDFAVYSDNPGKIGWACVCDMGFLSGVTRLSKFVVPHLKVEGLSFSKMPGHYYFTYKNEGTELFITVIRNLVVVTSDFENLEKAVEGKNDLSYTKEQLTLITQKDGKPFRIVADARKLAEDFLSEGDFLYQFTETLKKDSLTLVSFELKDSQILLNASLPFADSSDDLRFDSIINLLKSDCSVPEVLSQLSNLVQYYTIINLGSLKELKEALFPVFPPEMKIDSQWKNANSLCKPLLNASLEDLLFSWTGNEACVFGIEGLTDSVLAVQIKDEDCRKDVFTRLVSSLILKDDTSLILNGARLNRFLFPDFISGLLKSLKINLPSPYYLVQNDFIYFSQSPETLSAVYNSQKDGKRISKNPNWQAVSKNQKQETMLSLFYDLERSIPFFLKKNSIVSEVLSLYSIGRFDVRLKDSKLSVSIEASGNKVSDTRLISGFPLALGGNNDGRLIAGNDKKKETLFWAESAKTVKSYQISSGKITERLFSSPLNICSNPATREDDLWVLTENGEVFLLDKELQTKDNFPVLIEKSLYGKPAAGPEGLIIPTSDDKICFVSSEGKDEYVTLEGSSAIKSEPAVFENKILFYEKGFIGKIYIMDGKTLCNPDNPLTVNSIGYGSPVMFKKGQSEVIAFITQNGNVYLWENGILNDAFPLKLDGVFFTNLSYNGKYLFALSSIGQVYRIETDGSFMSVIIPSVQAKQGLITIDNLDKISGGNIYIGIDGNIIYGLNENLEMLSNFPLSGYGKPVFADVNGDNVSDVIALTLDKKLNAWNIK